jgi:hypothetical protein
MSEICMQKWYDNLVQTTAMVMYWLNGSVIVEPFNVFFPCVNDLCIKGKLSKLKWLFDKYGT